jgi:ribosomal protein S18 acetylase RimI-like enzyme
MATSESDLSVGTEEDSEPEMKNSNTEPEMADTAAFKNLTINDFLPCATESETTVKELNEFFNSSKIKQELHWFTHYDTLKRAFEREDRELFYIRPQDGVVAASMVWCESRVLESKQAQIRLIATHPNYREHGFARMLVDTCVSFAQSHDQTELIADVAENSQATRFWEACNLEMKTTYKTDGGRTMIRMRRDI